MSAPKIIVIVGPTASGKTEFAIETAEKLKDILKKKGYKFHMETPTNQQFIILENNVMEKLKEKVTFCFWEKYDENHTVIRLATDWATTEEDVETLMKFL